MTNSTPEDTFPLEKKIERLADQILVCHPKQIDNLIRRLKILQAQRISAEKSLDNVPVPQKESCAQSVACYVTTTVPRASDPMSTPDGSATSADTLTNESHRPDRQSGAEAPDLPGDPEVVPGSGSGE